MLGGSVVESGELLVENSSARDHDSHREAIGGLAVLFQVLVAPLSCLYLQPRPLPTPRSHLALQSTWLAKLALALLAHTWGLCSPCPHDALLGYSPSPIPA